VRRVFALIGLILLACGHASARADNPYGVMIQPLPNEGQDLALARARGLGVAWLRPPDVFLNHWNAHAPCPFCTLYRGTGLNLALVVKAQGQDWPSHRPSAPPADINGYKGSLDSLLEAWQPRLVVVEGGENDPSSLVNSGADHAAYLRELEAACQVAHSKRMFCTNGGLSSRSVAAAFWLDLLTKDAAQACDFAKRAFYTETDPDAGKALCAYQKPEDVPESWKVPVLADADKLLAQYRNEPIDVINFHWFIHDARALSQVSDYVTRTTNKPAVSSETGQWSWDAAQMHVRPILRAAIASQMQMQIWYSIETANTASLFGPDGLLRPTGWEFQRQIRGK